MRERLRLWLGLDSCGCMNKDARQFHRLDAHDPPCQKNGFNLPSTKDTQLLFGDEIKRSQ